MTKRIQAEKRKGASERLNGYDKEVEEGEKEETGTDSERARRRRRYEGRPGERGKERPVFSARCYILK